MKRCICLFLLVTLSGCGFSLRESYIRNQRPEYLKTHTSGPISPLCQRDIDEAISFGKKNKHQQNVINYAFIFTRDVTDFFGAIRRIYVLICTNYYLIADYSAKQTRNYNTIDMDYVNFLANLPTFRIEVMEQISPTGTFVALPVERNFVLLRDGVRVAESVENPIYHSKGPYSINHLLGVNSNWQEKINETMTQTIAMANRITETYQKDTQIDPRKIPTIPTAIPRHVYEYRDINLLSKFEIAVIYDDGEKRINLDFSKIK